MSSKHIKEIKRFQLDHKKKDILIKELVEVLDRHEDILFAYIYGSFLQEGYFRDIDIAIYVGDLKRERYFNYEKKMEMDLKKNLSTKLPLDVRLINRSPIPFKYHVLKGLLIVNHNDEKRIEFAVHTVSRYLDMKSLLSYYQKEAFVH